MHHVKNRLLFDQFLIELIVKLLKYYIKIIIIYFYMDLDILRFESSYSLCCL